jgi:hypothetical protein
MKVTLKQVATKAMNEPAFWKKLRANPDQTLEASKMVLDKPDHKRLLAILGLEGKTVVVDLARFMTIARRRRAGGHSDSLTWVGMWDEPDLPGPYPGPVSSKMPL